MLAGTIFWGYGRWSSSAGSPRSRLLAALAVDASAVFYADVAEFRGSPFAAQLYAWAPRSQIDPEYAQFLAATGFDYERDLDRLGLAVIKHGQDTTLFALADGRFNAKKIRAYALRSGTREQHGTRDIFYIPAEGKRQKISFTFLSNERIALTDGSDLRALLTTSLSQIDAAQWQERFDRLAGSPIFAVIRQDAAGGNALGSQVPGGFQSPQLATLLEKLRWITIAGKPESDRLRVVAEGECPEETAARQLQELLNGVLLMAQAGLNGPKIRQQLDPQTRDAYLEVLKGAEVSRIDRGETKSVRLIFDVTPRFLQAARAAPILPTTTPPATNQPPARKNRSHHKR